MCTVLLCWKQQFSFSSGVVPQTGDTNACAQDSGEKKRKGKRGTEQCYTACVVGFPAANVVVETNGGILTRVLEQKGYTYQLLERLGLASTSAFGCILRYLVRCVPLQCTVQNSTVLPFSCFHYGANSACLPFFVFLTV